MVRLPLPTRSPKLPAILEFTYLGPAGLRDGQKIKETRPDPQMPRTPPYVVTAHAAEPCALCIIEAENSRATHAFCA